MGLNVQHIDKGLSTMFALKVFVQSRPGRRHGGFQ